MSSGLRDSFGSGNLGQFHYNHGPRLMFPGCEALAPLILEQRVRPVDD
jgi:hypothetical protein